MFLELGQSEAVGQVSAVVCVPNNVDEVVYLAAHHAARLFAVCVPELQVKVAGAVCELVVLHLILDTIVGAHVPVCSFSVVANGAIATKGGQVFSPELLTEVSVSNV